MTTPPETERQREGQEPEEVGRRKQETEQERQGTGCNNYVRATEMATCTIKKGRQERKTLAPGAGSTRLRRRPREVSRENLWRKFARQTAGGLTPPFGSARAPQGGHPAGAGGHLSPDRPRAAANSTPAVGRPRRLTPALRTGRGAHSAPRAGPPRLPAASQGRAGPTAAPAGRNMCAGALLPDRCALRVA